MTKEATCTKEGEKVFTCTVCGETKTEAVPVIAHVWKTDDSTDEDGWKVVTQATATSEGSKERVCSVCGEKETQVIDKISSGATKPTTNTGTNATNNTGTKTNATKTGDPSINIFYVVLILIAAAGIAVFAVAGLRKRANKNS